MGIDIDPSAVLRSADAVTAAARHVGAGDGAGHPGNEGFAMSEAIGVFARRLHETTTDGARAMTATATRLDASARLMRSVDDDFAGAQRALWTRVR